MAASVPTNAWEAPSFAGASYPSMVNPLKLYRLSATDASKRESCDKPLQASPPPLFQPRVDESWRAEKSNEILTRQVLALDQAKVWAAVQLELQRQRFRRQKPSFLQQPLTQQIDAKTPNDSAELDAAQEALRPDHPPRLPWSDLHESGFQVASHTPGSSAPPSMSSVGPRRQLDEPEPAPAAQEPEPSPAMEPSCQAPAAVQLPIPSVAASKGHERGVPRRPLPQGADDGTGQGGDLAATAEQPPWLSEEARLPPNPLPVPLPVSNDYLFEGFEGGSHSLSSVRSSEAAETQRELELQLQLAEARAAAAEAHAQAAAAEAQANREHQAPIAEALPLSSALFSTSTTSRGDRLTASAVPASVAPDVTDTASASEQPADTESSSQLRSSRGALPSRAARAVVAHERVPPLSSRGSGRSRRPATGSAASTASVGAAASSAVPTPRQSTKDSRFGAAASSSSPTPRPASKDSRGAAEVQRPVQKESQGATEVTLAYLQGQSGVGGDCVSGTHVDYSDTGHHEQVLVGHGEENGLGGAGEVAEHTKDQEAEMLAASSQFVPTKNSGGDPQPSSEFVDTAVTLHQEEGLQQSSGRELSDAQVAAAQVGSLTNGQGEELQAVLEDCLDTIRWCAESVTRESLQDLAKQHSVNKPPPHIVLDVLEAATSLIGYAETRPSGSSSSPSQRWDRLRRIIGTASFLERVQKLNLQQNVSKEQFRKLRGRLDHPEFDEELIKTICVPVVPLAIWCRAIGVYLQKTKYRGGPDVRPTAAAGAAGTTPRASDEDSNGAQMPVEPPGDVVTFEPDLRTLSEEELRHVENLTISRNAVGVITFHGETDCTGIDFERVVRLEIGEVLVYPDSSTKPAIGVGLNKAATVTMYQCWPPSGGRLLQDPKSRDRYKRKIKNMTEEKHARFIDYDSSTGIWKFSVDHF